MVMVNLLSFFPWTFIMHLARALLSFNVFNSLMKPKHNIYGVFLIFNISAMLYSFLTITYIDYSISIMEYISAFGYYIILFAVSFLTFEGTVKKRLITTVFSFATYTIISLTYSLVYGIFFKFDINTLAAFEEPLIEVLAQSLFTFSMSFVFAAVFSSTGKKEKSEYKTRNYYLIYLFPITHILNIFILFMMLGQYRSNSEKFDPAIQDISLFSMIFFFICFVVDIAVIFAVDYIEKIEYKNREYEKVVFRNRIDYNKIKQMQEEKSELSKIRHDINGLISTVAGFIETGNSEKALSILNNTKDRLFETSNTYCFNELINIIISMKIKSAKADGKELSVNITENNSVNIDDYDLCRLLNNLIDNALNALDTAKIKKAVISLHIDKEVISITTENYFVKSEKKKSENHGFGTKIIADIAKKYGGKYTFRTNGEKYITKTVVDNVLLTVNN